MFLLVTGASGVGKTTARRLLEPQLPPEVECAELSGISSTPGAHTLEWRQHTTELAVQHAVRLQGDGGHFLLCGDPVAVVEVAAAPSAPELGGLAACLLDASDEAQAARLTARGDPSELLAHHRAFADWMRRQTTDPMYMLQAVTTNGWDQMRWDRLPTLASHWHVPTIDTTHRTPPAVAAAVLAWCRSALAGAQPLIQPPLAE